MKNMLKGLQGELLSSPDRRVDLFEKDNRVWAERDTRLAVNITCSTCWRSNHSTNLDLFRNRSCIS